MRPRTGLAAAALAALALGGCAAADKNASGQNAADTSSTASMSNMAGMSSSSGGSATGGVVSASSMSNMNTTTVVGADGVAKPVPVRTIGSGTWKSMRITAQETTPVPFYVNNGTSEREVKPGPQTSFHLMVMLSDIHTGQAIPYATVWASIFRNGKRIFNEPQWPMLSEYMGPHYGNNVSLPGPGTYRLSLLVSAPVAAMHVEYGHMWSGRTTINSTFTWPTKTS